MRVHALHLSLLGAAVACGHAIDTSIPAALADASTPDGGDDRDGRAAPDDDAAIADAGTDADREADGSAVDADSSDVDSGPACATLSETFTSDFASNPRQWTFSTDAMLPQFFSRNAAGEYGAFQSATAGTPPTPFLKHALGGCRPIIGASFVFLDDASGPGMVTATLLRVTLAADGNFDVRRSGGGFELALGGAAPIGFASLADANKHFIEVTFAADHATLKLDGASTKNVRLTPPVVATEFAIGIVTASSTANRTFDVRVDDISVE